MRRDLETLTLRCAPDGDPANFYDLEGDNDMSAHLREVVVTVAG